MGGRRIRMGLVVAVVGRGRRSREGKRRGHLLLRSRRGTIWMWTICPFEVPAGPALSKWMAYVVRVIRVIGFWRNRK